MWEEGFSEWSYILRVEKSHGPWPSPEKGAAGVPVASKLPELPFHVAAGLAQHSG